MHSEWKDGLVLRPMMDAGYTAWRGNRRVGIARLVDEAIVVEAVEAKTRYLLLARLESDARAAGMPGFADEQFAA
jgi:hypothetical protein